MKIQINSLEALERLVGEDKELEIQIKESILNGFAKNYLKSIANSKVLEELQQAIIRELEKTDYFGMMRKDTAGWSTKYHLTNELKDKIRNEVDNLVNQKIREALNEPVNDINRQIKERLDYLASTAAKHLLDEVVRGNLDKLVQQRLEEIFKTNNLQTMNEKEKRCGNCAYFTSEGVEKNGICEIDENPESCNNVCEGHEYRDDTEI